MRTSQRELIEKAHFRNVKAGETEMGRTLYGAFWTLDRPVAEISVGIDHEPMTVAVKYVGGENGEQVFRNFARAIGYAPKDKDAPFDTATVAGRVLTRWVEAVIVPQMLKRQLFHGPDADGAAEL